MNPKSKLKLNLMEYVYVNNIFGTIGNGIVDKTEFLSLQKSMLKSCWPREK